MPNLVAGSRGACAFRLCEEIDLIVSCYLCPPSWRRPPVREPTSAHGLSSRLVPSERSTGATVRRGGITKAGNGRVRHMLVESTWTYRPGTTDQNEEALSPTGRSSPRVREIAWKAQTRLTGRYRALSGRCKKTTVVCTAIAPRLVGFMWSVAREGADRLRSSAQVASYLLSAEAGAGPRQGNARHPLCGRPLCRRPL